MTTAGAHSNEKLLVKRPWPWWWWRRFEHQDDHRVHTMMGPTSAAELQPLQRDQQQASPPLTGVLEQNGPDLAVNDTTEHDNREEQTLQLKSPTFSNSWSEYFFPTTIPAEVQLWRVQNLAVPCCYLCVGVMQGLNRPLLNVYPLDLGATEAQQTTLAQIAILPAAFKIMYGALSDNVPVLGYRRKPYMILGWSMVTLSMTCLHGSANLSAVVTPVPGLSVNVSVAVDDDTTELAVPPEDAPSMTLLLACFFAFGIGIWCADVTADAIVAYKARLEPESVRGSLQSSCYAARFFGMMVAAPVSTYLYDAYGAGIVVRCLGGIPVLMLPLILCLHEERHERIASFRSQTREIWKTVCKRSVWQPMAFIYVFNVLQVKNAAWRQFLKSVWGFTSHQLNTMLVLSYVFLYIGITVYKFFLHTSWRYIYGISIMLNGLLSLTQLLLIKDMIGRLNPFWFALGDDAIAEFLEGIQFLPLSIMMVALCPPGSEGASYAMFTTFWNSAMMLSPALSSLLLGIWDTSKDALEAHDLDGLFKLSILTTALQTAPVLCLGWLPHHRYDLAELTTKKAAGTSAWGGGIFLIVLSASLSWTLIVGVLNIVDPGWSGAS